MIGRDWIAGRLRHAGCNKPGAIVLLVLDLFLLVVAAVIVLWLFHSSETGEHAAKSPDRQSGSDAHARPFRKAHRPHVEIVSGLESGPEEGGANRFGKLDAQGELLPSDASTWACVLDRVKRVVWEVKTNDGGWRDTDFTFSWYHINTQGEQSGRENGGDCLFINCDTLSYAALMNQRQHCGYSNWRLPTQFELQSLDHPVHFSPDIDRRFFPFTQSAQYWSGSESPYSNELAWSVDFSNGISYVREKRLSCHVRLVASM